jgi:hypothetical protein
MEEFLDAVSDGLVWGTGFGVAMLAVRSLRGGLRPIVKGTMRGAVVAGDWVRSATEESRETLQDLYHEARAEQQDEAGEEARV